MINKYPYTDFHELNADTLLRQMKQLEHSVSVLRRAVDQLAESGSGEVQQEIEQLQQDVSTINGSLANKVDKVTGKGLSSNDFTNADVTKLSGIETGAEVNVQANWNESDPTSDAYILNKPTITPGAPKNIWYGTCETGATTAAKVAATDTADFVLATGNMVRIKFTNGNSYNGTATLNVDGTGAVNIARIGSTLTTRYYWTAGEVVDFVYDGTNFVMSAKGTAGTTYYGLTKLSSSVSSTSEALAATPKAVKTVNDALAGKVDAVVGKGLSSNDFTDADVTKLSGIEAGAQVNPIFKYDIISSAAVATIAANGSTWVDATIPTGRTLIAINGFYISGTGSTACHLYALYPDANNSSRLQAAVKNMGTGAASGITVIFAYTYI